MSTFDPAKHPRGNQSTGHAGQFATKHQTGSEVGLGNAVHEGIIRPDGYDPSRLPDPDIELELTERFLNDPPFDSPADYHALYLNRENWGPSIAFLPADIPLDQARPEDFLISEGSERAAFIDSTGQRISLDTTSEQHYRFVGAISDDPIIQQRARIWQAGDEHVAAVEALHRDQAAIFADLPDNQGVAEYDKVGFNGISVLGTMRADGQMRRVYGVAVGGSNADGSRPFRIGIDTQGKVHTLYGDDSQKQQRYQQAIDDHPDEVARIGGHVTRCLETSKRREQEKESLRQKTGEYYG